MSVYVKQNDGGGIPEGAVRLTENQALRYQTNIIKNWPNYSEVFALKAGPGILGGLAAASAFFINNHFRYKLKLGNYGRMSSYLTVVATPTVFAALFHTVTVQSSVMLRKYDCPLCLQTRATLVQTTLAVLYPFLLAPVASFMFATRHFTYKLPTVTEQPKEVLKLWMKFTRSASNLTVILLAVNVLSAMYLTSSEMKEHHNVNLKLSEYEKRLENDSLTEEDLKMKV